MSKYERTIPVGDGKLIKIKIVKSPDTEEYIVKFLENFGTPNRWHGKEEKYYYAMDLDDAVNTMNTMAREVSDKFAKGIVPESRGIPKVRTWIVKFWKDGKVFHTEVVDTINKRFAYWEANEKSGYKGHKSDKVTVALSRHDKNAGDPRNIIRRPNPNLGDYTDGYQYGESVVQEKSVSKAQQRFMGMVHAVKKGAKAPSKEVAKAAKSMTSKDAEDFASTKHKGLPEKKSKKVKESTMNKQKKLMVEFIDNICNKEYAPARQKLAAIVNEKMKDRIRVAAGSETLEEKQTASEKRSSLAKRARKGEDIGKKGKGFAKVAAKAAKKYGSKERGEKVAAAAMWKNAGLKKRG